MIKKTNSLMIFSFTSLFIFLPLIMYPYTSELFEFNKILFIYLICLIIISLWVLKMILVRKIILKRTFLDIPILVFILSQVLSTIFSIDVHTSIFGYYGRFNGGLLPILCFTALYYAFVSNFSLRKIFFDIEKLLKISLLSSLIVIIWGLPGKLGFDLSCLVFMGQLNNNCWTEQFRPAERMFSTIGQPNWLGSYLAINFFIGLYFLFKVLRNNINFKKKQNRNKIINKFNNNRLAIFYSIYLFFNFSSILFTRSRSALLGIIFGLFSFSFFLLIIKFWKNFCYKKIIAFFFVIFVFPILFFKTGIEKIDKFIKPVTYLNLINKQKIIQQPSNIISKQYDSGITESMDIRKIVWKGAVNLGLRYPIFGSGVETFAYAYYFVRPKEHNLTSEWDYLYNKAHNEYLNYFATTGFIGLGTYLVMICFVVFIAIKQILNTKYQISKIQIKNEKGNKTIKQLDNEKFLVTNNQLLVMALLCSYFSILITNFFGFSTTTINLYFYLIPAFLIILFDSYNNKQINEDDSELIKNINLSGKQKFMMIFSITFAVYLLSLIIRYWAADLLYTKADNNSKINNYQEASKLLNQALQLHYEHVYEDKFSYFLANLAFIAFYQKQTDTAIKLIELSKRYNEDSIKASPKNVLYWKTKAKNHYLFYQINLDKKDIDNGLLALNKATNLSPTDPKIPYTMAIFYSLLWDDEKDTNLKNSLKNLTLNTIEKSINLKSDYRDGYFLKGQLYKKFQDGQEAKKAFQYILKNINPNDEEVKKEFLSL